jgi:hypothetical protein
MRIEPYIELKNMRADGSIKDHMERRPCRSFVKNYYSYVLNKMTGVVSSADNDTDCIDTIGVSKTMSILYQPTIKAPISEDTYGILVGTSAMGEVFGFDDEELSYNIGSLISSGTGVGELQYQAMSDPTVSNDGGTPKTWTIEWERYFNNSSGSKVTVKEATVVAKFTAENFKAQIVREVFSLPYYDVEDSGQLVLTFSLSIGSPA